MLDAYVGYDIGSVAEPDDIPRTDDTVWILGKQYRAIEGDYYIDHFQGSAPPPELIYTLHTIFLGA